MSSLMGRDKCVGCYDQAEAAWAKILAEVPAGKLFGLTVDLGIGDAPGDAGFKTAQARRRHILRQIRIRFDVCARPLSQDGPRRKCKEFSLPNVER
jgi:hypothetical protein